MLDRSKNAETKIPAWSRLVEYYDRLFGLQELKTDLINGRRRSSSRSSKRRTPRSSPAIRRGSPKPHAQEEDAKGRSAGVSQIRYGARTAKSEYVYSFRPGRRRLSPIKGASGQNMLEKIKDPQGNYMEGYPSPSSRRRRAATT